MRLHLCVRSYVCVASVSLTLCATVCQGVNVLVSQQFNIEYNLFSVCRGGFFGPLLVVEVISIIINDISLIFKWIILKANNNHRHRHTYQNTHSDIWNINIVCRTTNTRTFVNNDDYGNIVRNIDTYIKLRA